MLLLITTYFLAISVLAGESYHVCADPDKNDIPECRDTQWICMHNGCYKCHENGWCCDDDIWGPSKKCFKCDQNGICQGTDDINGKSYCYLEYSGAKCIPIDDYTVEDFEEIGGNTDVTKV